MRRAVGWHWRRVSTAGASPRLAPRLRRRGRAVGPARPRRRSGSIDAPPAGGGGGGGGGLPAGVAPLSAALPPRGEGVGRRGDGEAIGGGARGCKGGGWGAALDAGRTHSLLDAKQLAPRRACGVLFSPDPFREG